MNNWIGTTPELYSNPFASQTQAAVNELSNSNFGARAASMAERGIGLRYNHRMEEIDSDPNFGRNAAVSSKLKDMAAEETGAQTASAYLGGAQTDSENRVRGAQLGMQGAQLDMSISQENERRKDAASFGNSFVGGLIKDVVGYGAGALTGGVVNGLFAGGSSGGDTGDGQGGANTDALNNSINQYLGGSSGSPKRYGGSTLYP